MNIISMENIGKYVEGRTLFKDVSLGFFKGEKTGFIGQNGSGKSTFLNIISGTLAHDEGKLSRKKDLNISILEQTPNIPERISLKEFLYLDPNPSIQLVKKYYSHLDNYDHKAEKDAELELLTDKMDKINGWEIENNYISLLKEFGLPPVDAEADNLSGGMKKKIALARALAPNPDLLLLDEPTNHLDIDTIEWLEKYLKNGSSGFIMVTHDRYFLDRVCTNIMEIDRKTIYKYQGNYSTFLFRKKERLSIHENEQSRIESILKRELEWLKRGPRARTGKDKKRKENIRNLMESREREEDKEIEFSSITRRLGKKVMELKGVSKSFGDSPVVAPFSYNFKKGERIGIIGSNGSGKSTLLNLIAGSLKPDSGEIQQGKNTVIGYYDQLSAPLLATSKGSNGQGSDNQGGNKTVLEFIEEKAERIIIGDGQNISAARFLEMFNFPSEVHRHPVGTLSGGEKRRLFLISVLSEHPNLLLLDEPTNDLDLDMLQKLEEYLENFTGTLIVVSHDRAFLDRTTEYLFVFEENGKIGKFSGSYSHYKKKEEKENNPNLNKGNRKRPVERTPSSRKTKLTYKEEKEMNSLLEEIEALEEEKKGLEGFFTNTGLSQKEMAEKAARYKLVTSIIEGKTLRWEELASF